MRSLQGVVGNRAIVRLLREGSPGVQERSARQVQRVITLDGQALDLRAALEATGDVNERVILANWGWSTTSHDFVGDSRTSAAKRLQDAVAVAKAQVVDPPALYSAANLAFLTSAPGRLPTLYFIAGSTSGRIRQQHGAGPAVISQTNKVDYFFASRTDLDRFNADARASVVAGADFRPDLSTYNATTTPTANHHHYEVTYAGARVVKVHPSGGTVDTGIGAYDDPRIKSIYQKAIGART